MERLDQLFNTIIHDVIGLTLFLLVVVNTGSVLKSVTQLMKQFLPWAQPRHLICFPVGAHPGGDQHL